MNELRVPVSHNRTINYTRVGMAATAVLMVSSLVYVSAGASQSAHTDLDLKIAEWTQAISIPGLDLFADLVSIATDGPMAIALWVIAGAFFVLRGRPLEAVAVFMISGIWVGNEVLGIIVDRPVPLPEFLGTVESSRETGGSFPSGHVTGAVAFYGLMAFLAVSGGRGSGSRIIVPVLAVGMIGAASLSRVYVGAHWPSDILGSYLVGAGGVAAIAWFYLSVKEDSFHIPRLRKRQAPQPVDGVTVTGSIASTVYLDSRAGTATKEYSPPWPVMALYWLAFQAPFPCCSQPTNGMLPRMRAFPSPPALRYTTRWPLRPESASVSSSVRVSRYTPGARATTISPSMAGAAARTAACARGSVRNGSSRVPAAPSLPPGLRLQRLVQRV